MDETTNAIQKCFLQTLDGVLHGAILGPDGVNHADGIEDLL